MKIVFLGTTGYHPNEQCHTTCVMIPEFGIVFDAGTGFFRVADYLQTPELHIFLSHLHLDHICGLQYLYDVIWKYRNFKKGKFDKVNLYLSSIFPEKHREALLKLFEPPLFSKPLAQHDFEVHFNSKNTQVEDWEFWRQDLVHKDSFSTATTIKHQGKIVTFITDTTVKPENTNLFNQPPDLLMHECNFRNLFAQIALNSGHSHSRIVAEFAKNICAKKLALIHLNPLDPFLNMHLDEIRPIFENVILPKDKEEVII